MHIQSIEGIFNKLSRKCVDGRLEPYCLSYHTWNCSRAGLNSANRNIDECGIKTTVH